MAAYTEIELSTMDFTLFFEKNNKIVAIASNGYALDKFLTLDSDNQDKLSEYFYGLRDTSGFTINEDAPDYPDNISFTELAKKGIYAYDINMDSDEEILIAIPVKPLLADKLPLTILELLTEF